MRQLTMRTFLDMQRGSQTRRREQAHRDQAREAGIHTARAVAHQGGAISPGVEQQLARAFERVERCRISDTDDQGHQHPRPLTLRTLEMPLPPEVDEIPRGSANFYIDPSDRLDEYGRPLHRWNPEMGRFDPVVYRDEED